MLVLKCLLSRLDVSTRRGFVCVGGALSKCLSKLMCMGVVSLGPCKTAMETRTHIPESLARVLIIS